MILLHLLGDPPRTGEDVSPNQAEGDCCWAVAPGHYSEYRKGDEHVPLHVGWVDAAGRVVTGPVL